MPQNDFVPFATGAGANVYSVATYSAAAARQTGVTAGAADPVLANNSWRQGTVVASMIGQFIAAAGYDARDNGDLTTLLVNFQSAITALAQSGAPGLTSLVHSGVDTSNTANQIYLAAVTPDVQSLQDFQLFEIVPANSVTGATTVTIKSFGALPLIRRGGGQLVAGDAPAGAPLLAMKYGGAFILLGLAYSDIPAAVINSPVAGTRAVVPISSSTTFTVPASVFFLKRVTIWGAGGSGGAGVGSSGAGSGAGGGGYSVKFNIAVTPGQQIPITIGIGGAGSPNSDGNTGGTTSFGAFFSVTGGSKGFAGVNGIQSTSYGMGGNGVGGDVNVQGSNGSLAYSIAGTPATGIGGAAPFGGSIPTLNIGTAGNPGNFPGGGANGGANGGGSNAGANGFCLIEY